jgi:hypothetical protein
MSVAMEWEVVLHECGYKYIVRQTAEDLVELRYEEDGEEKAGMKITFAPDEVDEIFKAIKTVLRRES